MKLLLFIPSCLCKYCNRYLKTLSFVCTLVKDMVILCHYLVLKKQRKIIIKKPHTLSLMEDLSFENIIRK